MAPEASTPPLRSDAVLMLTEFEHAYPGSILQVSEQPSPVFAFLSSHSSSGFSLPSPHSFWHVALQPSFGVVPPSSHVSPASMVPSPHASWHTEPPPNALGTTTSRPSGLSVGPLPPVPLNTANVMVFVPATYNVDGHAPNDWPGPAKSEPFTPVLVPLT